MFRIASLAVFLLLANVSFAGDLLPIAFEDSTMTMGGRDVKCDLYYILIGDNGSLERGDLIQSLSCTTIVVSVRRTHGLSVRPKPGTVAVLRPAQGWVLARECR